LGVVAGAVVDLESLDVDSLVAVVVEDESLPVPDESLLGLDDESADVDAVADEPDEDPFRLSFL